MNCYLINAETINAYWAHGLLCLNAAGDAECVEYVSITQTPLAIFPPEYQIMTCACPTIGTFPYNVFAWFAVPTNPETVTVYTASGPQKVKVEAFPPRLKDGVETPVILTKPLAEGEVLGISTKIWDVNHAIGIAANKLHDLYPGNVNAIVIETGILAVGSPTNLAWLYVKMKQSSSSKEEPSAESKKSSKRPKG